MQHAYKTQRKRPSLTLLYRFLTNIYLPMKHLLRSLLLISFYFLFFDANAQGGWEFDNDSNQLPYGYRDLFGVGDSLLIATNAGLVIKEGNNFTTINQSAGLAEDTVIAVAGGDNGAILCLHPNHITYYSNSTFITYTNGVDYNLSLSVYEEVELIFHNGWFYLKNELALNGNIIHSIQPYQSVSYSFNGPNNTLYFVANTKYYEVANGDIVDSLLVSGNYTIVGNGQTAYGIKNDSIYEFNGSSWTAVADNKWHSDIYLDSEGELWSVSGNHIIRGVTNQEYSTPYTYNQLPNEISTEYANKIVVSFYDTRWVEVPLWIPFNGVEILELGDLQVKVNPDGSLGKNADMTNQTVNFDGVGFIFSGQTWLSGIETSSQDTFVSADRYSGYYNDEDDHYRFSSGPYADVFNYRNYKTYQVTAQEIQNHIANYNSPNYTMPVDIQYWPAHGNPVRGEAICLAPFVDADGDGDYHPENGDYPQIRGDKAAYTIFNDKYTENYLNQPSMGIEGHMMVYGYENTNSWLENTFFVNYRFVNRGNNNYENFKIGEFIDFDLGNPYDDYVGCDTTLNLYYAYNGDDIDEDNGGSPGFGVNTPAVGIVYLSDTLSSFMYFNNALGTLGDPETNADYYNYMNGYWKDGTHLTVGGNGYDSTTVQTNYMFSGDPVTQTGWTEASVGNTPYDRRGVGTGEARNFNAGDTIEFEFAIMLAENTSTTAAGAITDLRNQTSDVVQWFNNQSFDPWYSGCVGATVGIEEEAVNNSTVTLYPNPTQSTFTISGLEEQAQMRVYALDGSLMLQAKVSNRQSVDVSQLAKGIYIIQLLGNDQQENLRLVIQ